MKYVFCVLIGYAIGCINPSYLIGKLRGFDVRMRGSGNAGASNAVITMGQGTGIFCALLDMAKAFFAVVLSRVLFEAAPLTAEIIGSACILGHIFPFYMRFRGGKGLACLGGMILAFDWRVFLILLALAIIAVLVIDYICVVPISAAILYPLIYGAMTKKWLGAFVFCVASAAILLRHAENIRRIRAGTELRFSYLWNKDTEIKRVEANRCLNEEKKSRKLREHE